MLVAHHFMKLFPETQFGIGHQQIGGMSPIGV
jgi:hypothetical protein